MFGRLCLRSRAFHPISARFLVKDSVPCIRSFSATLNQIPRHSRMFNLYTRQNVTSVAPSVSMTATKSSASVSTLTTLRNVTTFSLMSIALLARTDLHVKTSSDQYSLAFSSDATLHGDQDQSATSKAGICEPDFPKIELYQYKICPYCNKVKAVLDFLGIPYSAVEVNPFTKEEIKGDDFDGYLKVPICIVDGQQINDSSEILSFILAKIAARKGFQLAGLDEKGNITDEQIKWTQWTDRRLAVLLFPNITRSMSESLQAFEYIWTVPHFSLYSKLINRYAGAIAMRLAQGKIKKKYDIDDERAALDEVVEEWAQALGNNSFLEGDDVSLADLCVFGCLRAIDGMDTFQEILSTHEVFRAWYERVADAVGETSCTDWA